MLIHEIPLLKNMIKILLALTFLFCLSSHVNAKDVYVRGYTRRDGRYVQPHYRSAPDGNPYNNWSTKGNINPYTGNPGTKNVVPGYKSLPQPHRPDIAVPSPRYSYDQHASGLRQEDLTQRPPIGSNNPGYGDFIENEIVDKELPYCKSYSVTTFVRDGSMTIKRCECNGKVLLTNLFCQCHPCINKEYSE